MHTHTHIYTHAHSRTYFINAILLIDPITIPILSLFS
jgi:hypothetical protein